MQRIIMAALVLTARIAGAQSAATPAKDVSGKWALTIQTNEGPQSRTLDLQMTKDGSVSGTVGSQYGDVRITNGRAKGDSLTLQFKIADGKILITYAGVIRSDTLRGVWMQDQEKNQLIGARTSGH